MMMRIIILLGWARRPVRQRSRQTEILYWSRQRCDQDSAVIIRIADESCVVAAPNIRMLMTPFIQVLVTLYNEIPNEVHIGTRSNPIIELIRMNVRCKPRKNFASKTNKKESISWTRALYWKLRLWSAWIATEINTGISIQCARCATRVTGPPILKVWQNNVFVNVFCGMIETTQTKVFVVVWNKIFYYESKVNEIKFACLWEVCLLIVHSQLYCLAVGILFLKLLLGCR